MLLRHNSVYKNISLLLKTAIVVVTLFYIYRKLVVKSDYNKLVTLISQHNFNAYILTAIVLMLFNWLFEALKWRLLIKSQEDISIQHSFKAILAGLSISLFTPNRIGEFAGRIYYLKKADKIKAALLSFVGSAYQLFCTISIGTAALLCWYFIHGSLPGLQAKNLSYLLICTVILIGLIMAAYFILFKNKLNYTTKILPYIGVFKTIATRLHLITLLLSLGRYIIFSLQFYLVLHWLQVDIRLQEAIMLIPITFFLIAAIPTFALSELGVRGATAVYILGAVSLNTEGILVASLLLWIINLAVPALAGLFFVFNLNFFESDTQCKQ